jgi:hypothetical protein
VIARELEAHEDQVDLGTTGALQHEVRPPAVLVELRPAANPAIGTPLPLTLEKLAFLSQPSLDLLTPALGVAAQTGRRL